MISSSTAERTLRSILAELEEIEARLTSIEAQVSPQRGYLTKAAAGRYIGRSRTTISELCSRGVIPVTKSGLVRMSDIIKYAEEGEASSVSGT